MGTHGLFVAIEGLDHSGKTTQAKLLTESFTTHGVDIVNMCFPDRTTTTGNELDKYLHGQIDLSPKKAHKLFARNRGEKRDLIKEYYQEGKLIITDRYMWSGIAYTLANCDDGSITKEWCIDVEDKCGGIRPDITFLLDILPEEAQSRYTQNETKERYETPAFQEKVFDAFHASRKLFSGQLVIIDATLPASSIHRDIFNWCLELYNYTQ